MLKKKKKKNPTPLIPFHSATNPLTHITLLSHSATLTPFHSPHITLLSPTSDLCHHRPSRAPPVRLFALFLSISAHTISHSHSLSISFTFKQRRPRSQPLTAVQAFTHSQSHRRPKLSPQSVLYFSSIFLFFLF